MTKKFLRILVCEDDKYFRIALKDLLKGHGEITEVDEQKQALKIIDEQYFDLALIDINLGEKNSGLEILKACKYAGIHSIILSSQNDESIIEQAYQYKCDHFLTKLHYRKHLESYIVQFKNRMESKSLDDFFQTKFITQDKQLKDNISQLTQINLKGKTVLITGETGVGKSLIGELLHQQTFENDKPFIHINCSEIPENLIESELFGHEKGSFTGAHEKKKGKLKLADGGTLFLDEIGTMPMIMQKKLLKALDAKSFYPVGSDKPVQSDFTLISATCEDLFEKIHAGLFRKDLFFRISGFNLEIPALRKRPADISLLIKFFASHSPRKFVLKKDALEACQKHGWPGNTRELKKKIEILSSLNQGIIYSHDLNFQNMSRSGTTDWLTESQKDFIQSHGLREFIKKVEQESLQETLKRNNGKVTQAIKDLKISASAFYRIFDTLQMKL